MAAPTNGEVTLLLNRIQQGDHDALADLAPLVAPELRRMAARSLRNDAPGQTWQPTDLVNELWVRLLKRGELRFESRVHFLGAASHLMRDLVIDHARRRCALKRTPDALLLESGNEFETLLGLTDGRAAELVALEDALSSLAARCPRQAEIVEMRYFGGLTVEETAEALGISPKTVKREWAVARVLLHAGMRGIEE